MLLAGFVVSLSVAGLLIRFERLHAGLSHDHQASGPQKFHARPTPRIGGVPVAIGSCCAVALAIGLGALQKEFALAFGIALLPAFCSGLLEDVTKRIGPDIRLWASFLSALLAVLFFDAVVDRCGIPGLDTLLGWYPLALIFTMVGIGGVAHAVNIIDGYNGLASMVTCMMLAALGFVAWQVGDTSLALIAAALAGSTLGFLRWNFPSGRMFAGDGGAYAWGVSVAILSVLLIARNPQVSPWFPMAVLVYPVFETLFTIYRRKLKQAAAAGLPDARHLHQMVYRRLLFRGVRFDDRCPDLQTIRNASTSPFLWLLASCSIVPATLFWDQTPALIGITATFCVLYVWVYRAFATFSVPQWLWRLGDRATVIARTYHARKTAQ